MSLRLAAVSMLAFWTAGCTVLNRQFDHLALSEMSTIATRKSPGQGPRPLPFTTREELDRLTRPGEPPVVLSEVEDRLTIAGEQLTQQTLSFDSAVKVHHRESDRVVAHVYRRGPLGERPVVLWVPGLGVSQRHWPSMQKNFGRILELGADVVVYEPPYHLSRKPAGADSAEILLAADFADLLSVFAQEVSDLRRLAVWLRARGVKTLGGVGTSLGAQMLMLAVTFDATFDYLLVIKPLVDWSSVLARPEMAPVRLKIEAQEVTPQTMAQVFRALDPRSGKPRLLAQHIAILYGRDDQLALATETLALADAWDLANVKGYPCAHFFCAAAGGGPPRDALLVLAQWLSRNTPADPVLLPDARRIPLEW
ncbi:MAG: hypothetical protein HY901_17975 [Deltaproteobacteria bacterium]|nr:hypothetical protein [Deltaproteobacteria bacterium]